MFEYATFESLFSLLIQNPDPPQPPHQLIFKASSAKTQWLADAFNQLPPQQEWLTTHDNDDEHPLMPYFMALEKDPPSKPLPKVVLFAPDVLSAFFKSRQIALTANFSVDSEMEGLLLDRDLNLSSVRQ